MTYLTGQPSLEGCDLSTLAARWETPLFIYRVDLIRRTYRALRETSGAAQENTTIAFASKAGALESY